MFMMCCFLRNIWAPSFSSAVSQPCPVCNRGDTKRHGEKGHMNFLNSVSRLTPSRYVYYGGSRLQPIECSNVVQFDNWICRLAESCTAHASPENFILLQPDPGVVLG